MTTSTSMRDLILDAAEQRIRSVGYNAVSFRDLAADVGVKSASVHYYFPQKSDLGVELVKRYSDAFKARLDVIDTSNLAVALQSFLDLYGEALIVGRAVCLCAILGAEANGLPEEVTCEVSNFFDMNAAWLANIEAHHALPAGAPLPFETIAILEGAMIVASVRADRSIFTAMQNRIMASYTAP